MDLYEYNAWSEAWEERIADTLSIGIQSAYYAAYWSGFNKHKKSLKSILKSIRPKRKHTSKPIDIDAISKQLRRIEELAKNGWTK